MYLQLNPILTRRAFVCVKEINMNKKEREKKLLISTKIYMCTYGCDSSNFILFLDPLAKHSLSFGWRFWATSTTALTLFPYLCIFHQFFFHSPIAGDWLKFKRFAECELKANRGHQTSHIYTEMSLLLKLIETCIIGESYALLWRFRTRSSFLVFDWIESKKWLFIRCTNTLCTWKNSQNFGVIR